MPLHPDVIKDALNSKDRVQLTQGADGYCLAVPELAAAWYFDRPWLAMQAYAAMNKLLVWRDTAGATVGPGEFEMLTRFVIDAMKTPLTAGSLTKILGGRGVEGHRPLFVVEDPHKPFGVPARPDIFGPVTIDEWADKEESSK